MILPQAIINRLISTNFAVIHIPMIDDTDFTADDRTTGETLAVCRMTDGNPKILHQLGVFPMRVGIGRLSAGKVEVIKISCEEIRNQWFWRVDLELVAWRSEYNHLRVGAPA